MVRNGRDNTTKFNPPHLFARVASFPSQCCLSLSLCCSKTAVLQGHLIEKALIDQGTLAQSKETKVLSFLVMQVNWFVDNIILAYGVAVAAIIWSFWFFKEKGVCAGNGTLGKFAGSEAQTGNGTINVGSKTKLGWREGLQGQWKQVESENLDNFGLLSNQSKIRRTLGALAFYRVRHKISFQQVPSSSECDKETAESRSGALRFCLLRDLGEGMQEWTVEAIIGTSRDTAEVVERRVDTPGYEKMYRYRVWVEVAQPASGEGGTEGKGQGQMDEELLMESEPVEIDEDSIRTLQIRSLVSKNRMKMVSHLPACLPRG